MTPREIKEALLRRHPESGEAEAEGAEALAQAKADPELRAWWGRQERFDEKMRASLHSIQPPRQLKERILAGRKIIPLWRRPALAWFAAAAALALIAGTVLWTLRPVEDRTFAGFQSRMVGFALREYRMEIETNSPAAVQAHFRQHDTPAGFPLPASLSAQPVKGGASLTWKGHPVSMLCFDWGGDETLYLFVIPEEKVVNPPAAQPEVRPYKTITTAHWKENGLVYLLVGAPGDEVLKSLVERSG